MLAREAGPAPGPGWRPAREAGTTRFGGGRQGAMLKRVSPAGHGGRPSAAASSLMLTKGVSWV
ncbi:hypothetical protein GCM10009735_08380 [Actinomadura chokoriensis]